MEQKVANVSLHRPKRTGYTWKNRVLCSGSGTSLTPYGDESLPTRLLYGSRRGTYFCIGRLFHPGCPRWLPEGNTFGPAYRVVFGQLRGEKSKGHFVSLVPRCAQHVMSVGLLRIQFHAKHAHSDAAYRCTDGPEKSQALSPERPCLLLVGACGRDIAGRPGDNPRHQQSGGFHCRRPVASLGSAPGSRSVLACGQWSAQISAVARGRQSGACGQKRFGARICGRSRVSDPILW